MVRQNFDPLEHSVRDLLQFCEGIEQLEPTSTTNHNGSSKKQDHNKRRKGSSDKGNSTGKWCTFHKTDSHDSSECKVLLNKDKAKPNYTNKTWKRKADDSKSYSKEELNALMKKVVNEARKSWDKKDQKTGTKRKKAEANLLEEDSDSQTSATNTDSSLSREEVNQLQAEMNELDRQLEEIGIDGGSDTEIDV
jgi:hypothetical protein